MSAQIIRFRKKEVHENPSSLLNPEMLNGLKIKMIDYFKLDSIPKVHLNPVNLDCPYERILLPICSALSEITDPEDVHTAAELIFTANTKNLSLQGFIDKIKSDDLLLACLQVELRKLTALDKLFLINVLKTKFPKEGCAADLLKLILFANDQEKLLEAQG